MFKSLVFCVLLSLKTYEINGYADPVSTVTFEQAESKRMQNLRAALLNSSLLDRASPISNLISTGEELVTGYVMTKGIGAHRLHLFKLNWNDARQYCIAERGHLVVIRSNSEANIVRKLMIDAFVDAAWIGLHDQFEKGHWISVLDEPLHEIGWAYWSRIFYPNPDYRDNNQNCVRILKGDAGMMDENCNSASPFICKISMS